MKISVAALILPLVGGAVSGVIMPLSQWDALRPALLPAVSVIAAAVLVRLARGLPFTNADHFSLDQFRLIARNLELNARKLRALIFVCLAGITLLIVATDAVNAIAAIPRIEPWVVAGWGHTLSALIAALLIYAFTRIIAVVHSDVSLLKLQSGILEKVIANKNATTFEKAVASKGVGPIVGAGSYGRTLPH